MTTIEKNREVNFVDTAETAEQIKNPNHRKQWGIIDNECWDFLSLELGYSVAASGGV